MITGKKFRSLIEMQEDSCRRFHNRELFGTKINGHYKWVTYRQFATMVDELRGGLAQLGVGENSKVAVIGPNSVQWAVACYATMGLKGQFLSMYESQTGEEIEYILNDSEARVVFVSSPETYEKVKNMMERVPALQHIVLIDEQKQTSESHYSSIITFSMLLKTGQKQPTPVQPSMRDDMMGIIYTSGTTGNPKGVLLTHGNLLSNITVVPNIIQVSEVDRSLSFLPWAHIFGQMAELHLIIYVGCSTAFAENVNSIIQNLSEVRPTFLVAVPRIFNRIYDSIQSQMRDKPFPIRMLFNTALDLAKKKNKKMHLTTKEMLLLKAADRILFKVIRDKFGGRLRFAVSGASSLSTEVAEFIDALNILILEGYGLSETSPLVTVNTFTQRKIGSVGKVISGVRVKIDKTVLGDSVADCEEGEVIVYGLNVMKGYHKLDQETAAVMTADKGFRTGDLGRIDKDGFLFITGRIKEQYKLENGKYVSPGHIEEKLKLSPYISNAFIYGTNKSHNIALLGVNMDELHKFAKANKITIRGKSLLQIPEVKDLYENELLKYEKAFKSYERPHGFALVEDDWSPDNGMLTPSLKLKRRHVYGRYKQTIENLYQ